MGGWDQRRGEMDWWVEGRGGVGVVGGGIVFAAGGDMLDGPAAGVMAHTVCQSARDLGALGSDQVCLWGLLLSQAKGRGQGCACTITQGSFFSSNPNLPP